MKFKIRFLALLFGSTIVQLPSQRSLHNVIRLPNLLSNVLVVYHVNAIGNHGTPDCRGTRLAACG